MITVSDITGRRRRRRRRSKRRRRRRRRKRRLVQLKTETKRADQTEDTAFLCTHRPKRDRQLPQ